MARDVRVAILGDSRDFSRAVANAKNDVAGLGRSASNLGRNLALGFGAAAAGAVVLAKGFVDAAVESQKVTAQTGAVIKSMGLGATVTADQIADLSTQLSLKSGIDDELIQSGSNLLLTFANLAESAGESGGAFERANAAALDMSVAMGTDMKSASMQVGKALNDPIAGISRLSRAGVQFTDEQKKTIKALQEGGDMAGAQAVMLKELEKQFGGSAAAQATAGDKLKVAWGNIQEQLGEKLLPVFERVATFLADNLPGAMEVASRFLDEKLIPAFKTASEFATSTLVPAFKTAAEFVTTTLVPAFKTAAEWLGERLPPVIEAVARWITEQLVPAVKEAAAWFNEHMMPAIRDVAAWVMDVLVPAIAKIAEWIFTKFVPAAALIVEWIVQRLVPAIQNTAKWINDNLIPAVKTIAGWIVDTLVPAVGDIITKLIEWGAKAGEIALTIVGWFLGVVDFVTSMPDEIASAASGMWEGLKNGLVEAINWIIDKWNSLDFSIPKVTIPGIGSFGGGGDIIPDIPRLGGGGGGGSAPGGKPALRLARGGVIDRPTLAVLGDGMGRNRREIATPENLLRQIMREEGGAGNGSTVVNHFNIGRLDQSALGELLHRQKVIQTEMASL